MDQPIRILVIDDEQQVLDSYKCILEPEENVDLSIQGAALFKQMADEAGIPDRGRYELILKKNGAEGVDAIKTSQAEDLPIAVAFIDMKMPGINGAETARQIWCLDPDIRIVFVTAYSEYRPDEINSHTNREDSFYLNKPFNPDEIRQFAKALTKEWTIDKIFRKILFS